jgi:hypothetical protein
MGNIDRQIDRHCPGGGHRFHARRSGPQALRSVPAHWQLDGYGSPCTWSGIVQGVERELEAGRSKLRAAQQAMAAAQQRQDALAAQNEFLEAQSARLAAENERLAADTAEANERLEAERLRVRGRLRLSVLSVCPVHRGRFVCPVCLLCRPPKLASCRSS